MSAERQLKWNLFAEIEDATPRAARARTRKHWSQETGRGLHFSACGLAFFLFSLRLVAFFRINRIAGDDNELALMSLAVRPLASPPFPLDRLSGNQNPG